MARQRPISVRRSRTLARASRPYSGNCSPMDVKLRRVMNCVGRKTDMIPVTTMKIEDILLELKERMTIVLVTNLVQQARRLAEHTAFISDSELIETGDTETLFTKPANRLTERFVNGEFG